MNSLLLSVFLLLSAIGFSQNICDSSGNMLIYSNFEGGVLNIVVDQDIENLHIGVNSYYNVEVRLTGPYAKNVTTVYCTGTGKKGPCGLFVKSSVTGAPESAKITISPLSYFAPCGGFEGGVSCNEGYYDPTYEELIDFFSLTAFPGAKLYSYKQQFECWTGTKVLVSQGGNCCVSDLEVVSAKAGRDKVMCVGQKVQLGVHEFNCDYIKQTWSPAEGLDKTTGGMVYANPKKTTTYTVTMKNNGVETVDQVTVFVKDIPKTPVVTSNSPVCEGQALMLSVTANLGESYTWEGPGGFIASDAVSYRQSVTKAAAGTYTVHADLNGCGTKSAVVKVIVKACAPKQPAIAATTPKTEKKPPVKEGNYGSGLVKGSTSTKPVIIEKPVTAEKPATTKPTSAAKSKYTFSNSRKNGVFIVDGFSSPIDAYEPFEVVDSFGEPVRCKRIKFGDKLIVDISDKPFGKYTLVVSIGGTKEAVEFIFDTH